MSLSFVAQSILVILKKDLKNIIGKYIHMNVLTAANIIENEKFGYEI